MLCHVVQLITSNKHGHPERPSSVMDTCLGAFLITMQELTSLGDTIDPGNLEEVGLW
jgi:hypothetical protein